MRHLITVVLIGLIVCFGVAGLAEDDVRMGIHQRVNYSNDTKSKELNDAIYRSQEVYANMTEQDKIDAKQTRIDVWVNRWENPPEYIPPTLLELKDQYLEIEDDLTQIYFDILERDNPLPVLKVLRNRLITKLQVLQDKIEELESE